MKKTLRISVLLMVLACSARAGDIPNGATDPPPPPPTSSTVATDGDIPNMLTTQAALDMLGSLLSLF